MVIILRGISGAGKTEIVRAITSGLDPLNPALKDTTYRLWKEETYNKPSPIVISADDFFMVKGEYKFDPKMLPAAHQGCLRSYSKILMGAHDLLGKGEPTGTIIVDNTNCSLTEVSPYASLAQAYAHDVLVITLLGDPDACWRRNRHGAPFANVLGQDMALRKSLAEWPPWFPQQIFPA